MAPGILGFHTENYRGFARGMRAELRPLTLVFGYNNVGKSSLVRFLPLLCESLEAGRAPLLLDGKVLRRAGYRDLTSRAVQSGKLAFGVRLDDGSALDVEIRGDSRSHEVEELRYRDPQGADHRWTYESPTPFRSFVPRDRAWSERLRDVEQAIQGVQWLRGLRAPPERWRSLPSGLGFRLDPDGSDAADWLAAEGNRSGVADPDSLGGVVASFFERLGLRISVEERNEQYTVNLSGRAADAWPVPLADSGEGYVQVLPVLVAVARAGRDGPRVVAMEQPELHLHTHAQRHLGAWLAEQVARCPEARILVETHSEVLLTAVELAVASGRLKAEDVGLCWVRREDDGTGTVEPIAMKGDGRLSGAWPLDVFGDLPELTRELHAARGRGRGA